MEIGDRIKYKTVDWDGETWICIGLTSDGLTVAYEFLSGKVWLVSTAPVTQMEIQWDEP